MIALGEGLFLSPCVVQQPVLSRTGFFVLFFGQQKSPAEGRAFNERNTFRSLSLFRP